MPNHPTGKDIVYCSVSNRVLYAEDAVFDSDGTVYAPEHAPPGVTQLPGYNAPADPAAEGAAGAPSSRSEAPAAEGLPEAQPQAEDALERPLDAVEPEPSEDVWSDLGNRPRGRGR